MLVDEQGGSVAARCLAELAGAKVARGWRLPERPWDLASVGLVVEGTLGHDAPEEHLVSAVVRGAGAIVAVDRQAPAPARLLEALRRVGPVLDWLDCPMMRLDPTQIRLLASLASGANVRTAAESENVSLRTAHRRIAEAKDSLGASSTNAAAAELATAARVWRL